VRLLSLPPAVPAPWDSGSAATAPGATPRPQWESGIAHLGHKQRDAAANGNTNGDLEVLTLATFWRLCGLK